MTIVACFCPSPLTTVRSFTDIVRSSKPPVFRSTSPPPTIPGNAVREHERSDPAVSAEANVHEAPDAGSMQYDRGLTEQSTAKTTWLPNAARSVEPILHSPVSLPSSLRSAAGQGASRLLRFASALLVTACLSAAVNYAGKRSFPV